VATPYWRQTPNWTLYGMAAPIVIAVLLSSCTPTVRLEVPDKPIVINLNVKIEQEVRIKLEKGVEEVVEENPDIF
jgi:hypothetical protein